MNVILPNVIAHRGAPKEAPENTLASFNKAIARGAKWIECDVQLTHDEEPILMHDFTFERTAGVKAKVCEVDYRDLKKWEVGSWFSPDFKGEPIPTLADLLSWAKQHHIGVNLELKCNDGREKALAEIVLENIKAHWGNYENLLVSSFNLPVLTAMRRYNIEIPLGLNCENWDLRYITQAKKIECFSIHIDEKDITPTVIEECKTNFLAVLAYTINETERAKQLLKQGVTSIFSDTLFNEYDFLR